MAPRSKSDRVDYLIDHLWQHGYLTLSRKFGKYLPAPPRMGEYEVDAVAKFAGSHDRARMLKRHADSGPLER